MRGAERIHACLEVLVLWGRTGVSAGPPPPPTAWCAPWGSSVISSAATWPSRSLVACTLELKPFASLLADWPRLRLARPVWSCFQLAAMSREDWERYVDSIVGRGRRMQNARTAGGEIKGWRRAVPARREASDQALRRPRRLRNE